MKKLALLAGVLAMLATPAIARVDHPASRHIARETNAMASPHDRYVTLNQTFGNAWRVSNSNSLFDYAAGTSTATFTNAAWPEENAKTCSLPNVKTPPHISAEAAEDACRSITNTYLHSSCVFDVQTTGITHFAETYAITERVHIKLAVKPIVIK